MEVIADTTVLIDIWRYQRKPKKLSDLKNKLAESALIVPWITQAEFSRGAIFQGVSNDDLIQFYTEFQVQYLTQVAINIYCNLWGDLARSGKVVDYPDLWISASALEKNIPLITRNPKHFLNIPNLDVIDYEIL